MKQLTIKQKIADAKKIFLPQHVAGYTRTIIIFTVIGYVIRALMMPIFAESDLISLSSVALYLNDYHKLLPAPDPPLIFYIFSSIYTIFNPFFHLNFRDLLTQTAYTPSALSNIFRISSPGFIQLVTITKLPYLLFDFAIAFLLLHVIEDGRKAVLAFELWMLNPFTLYICYAIGQYDVIPAFFLLLSLYFVKKQKPTWSLLSVGIASAFKLFTLILIPFFLLANIKSTKSVGAKAKSTILLLIVALLPVILTVVSAAYIPSGYQSANVALPSNFDLNGYLGHTLYIRGAVQTNPSETLFTFFLDYSASLKTYSLSSDTIYIVLLSYGLLLLAAIYYGIGSFDRLYKILLAFLLLYYAFSLFHVQWFLWVQPLLMLLIAYDRKFLKFYLFLIPLFFIYTWYWDPATTTNLLAPIDNHALFWTGPVNFINNLGLPATEIIGAFRSLFSAVCLFLAVLIVKPDLFSLFNRNDEKA